MCVRVRAPERRPVHEEVRTRGGVHVSEDACARARKRRPVRKCVRKDVCVNEEVCVRLSCVFLGGGVSAPVVIILIPTCFGQTTPRALGLQTEAPNLVSPVPGGAGEDHSALGWGWGASRGAAVGGEQDLV